MVIDVLRINGIERRFGETEHINGVKDIRFSLPI
jgi:hypothetical protein